MWQSTMPDENASKKLRTKAATTLYLSILSIFGYKNSKKYVNKADRKPFYFDVCGIVVNFATY